MLKKQRLNTFCLLFLICTTPLFAQDSLPPEEQEQKQATDISDVELKKFTDAYREIQDENKKAQGRLVAIIEKEGMDLERFTEIQKASMNPNSTLEISDDEKAQYKRASMKLKKMQTTFKYKMKNVMATHGLTEKRFNEIFAAVQKDAKLQQKVKTLMQK